MATKVKQINSEESYSGFGTVIELSKGKNKYVWTLKETGMRKGNDRHMEYEVSSVVTHNGKEILNSTRYLSEYTDHTIEFSNTFSNILSETMFKEAASQIHY